MMIILIRHAMPIIDYSSCDAKALIERLNAYNLTERLNLQPLGATKKDLYKLIDAKQCIIHVSTLPRSSQTAAFLFDHDTSRFQTNPIFSEFDLPILRIPLLKLPVKAWFFLYRVLWMLGLHRNSRTFTEEKQRAKKVARLLMTEHQGDAAIIVVGHGWMNRYIKRYLKRAGWVEAYFQDNLSFSVLELGNDVNLK